MKTYVYVTTYTEDTTPTLPQLENVNICLHLPYRMLARMSPISAKGFLYVNQEPPQNREFVLL